MGGDLDRLRKVTFLYAVPPCRARDGDELQYLRKTQEASFGELMHHIVFHRPWLARRKNGFDWTSERGPRQRTNARQFSRAFVPTLFKMACGSRRKDLQVIRSRLASISLFRTGLECRPFLPRSATFDQTERPPPSAMQKQAFLSL